MANPWFRLYSKIMTDPKVEYLSFEDQRHFVWLLCMKNEGYLDEEFPKKEIRERMIARKLGLQGEAFENAKKRLQEMELIDKDWQPISWDELQFKSDSSKERVAKFRKKQKKKTQESECNVTSNVTPDVTVTRQDTDTEEDKEKETLSESVPSVPGSGPFFPSGSPPSLLFLENLGIELLDSEIDDAWKRFKLTEFRKPKSDWHRAFAKFCLEETPRYERARSSEGGGVSAAGAFAVAIKLAGNPETASLKCEDPKIQVAVKAMGGWHFLGRSGAQDRFALSQKFNDEYRKAG